MLQKIYSTIGLLLLSLWFSGNALALEDPETFTLRTTNEVLELLRKNDALIQSDPDAMFNIVSNKVIPLFNFTRMTQLAMGRYWNQADTEQKKRWSSPLRTF